MQQAHFFYLQTLNICFLLQILLVGPSSCGAPQDQEKPGSFPVEAGELRRPVGPAENRQDAPNYCAISPATQNDPPGRYFISYLLSKAAFLLEATLKVTFFSQIPLVMIQIDPPQRVSYAVFFEHHK